jgi:hypothetical protein
MDTLLYEQGCEDLVIFLSQSQEQISLGATGLTHKVKLKTTIDAGSGFCSENVLALTPISLV